MQVKNISDNVVHFQVESELSTAAAPLFKTIQVGAGATADISGRDWDQIKDQEFTVEEFSIEETPITGVTMKDADGKPYTPTKKRAFGTGKFTTHNMIKDMVKKRVIELITEESQEDLRSKFESAAKAMGIKVTKEMSLEDIKASIKAVKDALELV
jgi:hypothetical protein